jgi:hypothetical protein
VLLQGFSQDLPVCEVLVLASIGNIPAGLDSAMHTFLAFICVRCISRRCSRALSPRAWARSRRSGRALRLVCTFPRRPSAEALPRWDPSTSCPRWLLNTTCGAPSSW